MVRSTVDLAGEDTILARLSVIESKIETLIEEIGAIREYVPARMVEHTERIIVLERNVRTIQWLAGVFATGIVGAFLAHIFGG